MESSSPSSLLRRNLRSPNTVLVEIHGFAERDRTASMVVPLLGDGARRPSWSQRHNGFDRECCDADVALARLDSPLPDGHGWQGELALRARQRALARSWNSRSAELPQLGQARPEVRYASPMARA
jgi:hypothetical protein